MAKTLRELTSTTLADQAYGALRGAILSGELARGQRVTERGLAELLSISATPVREAIRRLEQDRLMERTGPRSVRVAEVNDRTMSELALIEGTLRALAARLAADNATDAQLARMGKALDAADVAVDALAESTLARSGISGPAAKALSHVREFHRLVDQACGNEILMHLLSMVEAFTFDERVAAPHDRMDGEGDGGPAQRFAEHRQIYEALLAHDGDQVESLMLRHARAGAAALASLATR